MRCRSQGGVYAVEKNNNDDVHPNQQRDKTQGSRADGFGWNSSTEKQIPTTFKARYQPRSTVLVIHFVNQFIEMFLISVLFSCKQTFGVEMSSGSERQTLQRFVRPGWTGCWVALGKLLFSTCQSCFTSMVAKDAGTISILWHWCTALEIWRATTSQTVQQDNEWVIVNARLGEWTRCEMFIGRSRCMALGV